MLLNDVAASGWFSCLLFIVVNFMGVATSFLFSNFYFSTFMTQIFINLLVAMVPLSSVLLGRVFSGPSQELCLCWFLAA